MNIGEVSNLLNLSISTLRYYDKEGLLTNMKRSSSGIRKFDENDIDTLKIIKCLKNTGMQIKDIKIFLNWCQLGDPTLEKRKNMFYERKIIVENQIKELNKTLEVINFKCSYYENAIKNTANHQE